MSYLQWCNLSPLNWSNDFFFDRFVIIAQKRMAWGVTETPNLHILHFSFQQKKPRKAFTFVKALKEYDTGHSW